MRRLWTLAVVAVAFAAACSGVDVKLTCKTDKECFNLTAGQPGVNYVCDLTQTKVCLRACSTTSQTSDCLVLQYCDAPSGSTDGVCRDGAPDVDSGGGDANPGDH